MIVSACFMCPGNLYCLLAAEILARSSMVEGEDQKFQGRGPFEILLGIEADDFPNGVSRRRSEPKSPWFSSPETHNPGNLNMAGSIGEKRGGGNKKAPSGAGLCLCVRSHW
jgi:hypothetical protein